MRRYFNTEGTCNPRRHYMVDIRERLEAIKTRYIERGSYFVINRGRQYGKTTTLRLLEEYLKPEYLVVYLDFQMLGSANFKNEESFVSALKRAMSEAFRKLAADAGGSLRNVLEDSEAVQQKNTLDALFIQISRICEMSENPVVLMIDEVDAASNYQVFLDFLAMLRGYYLDRENSPVFQSVILAGVYDIKNLKLKLRPDAEHKYNSPWNIAADFDMNMNFTARQIAAMLEDYEGEQHTGMDINSVAEEIFQYTSGYPYLVSAICKLLDEKLPETDLFTGSHDIWSAKGISQAVQILMQKKVPLFESMMRQFDEHPDIKQMLKVILFEGKRVTYNLYNSAVDLAMMFGYIVNKQGSIQVSNRIFEMLIYNLFLSEEELTSAVYNAAQENKNQYFQNGKLDMEKVLEKFVIHFSDIYGENDEKFVESNGRKFFLLYLKPIINGTGNYYIEAQTRDARRTDVIVDYLGEQFIIELKIWRGNEYNERGEAQLTDYLDYYHKEKGYLLSFNFNQKKQCGVKEIRIDGRTIVEAVV